MKTTLFQLAIAGFVFLAINAPATVLYVDVNSTNPVSPYADWSTAATNIQDAIDRASDDDLILVANGIYQTGGRVVYGSLTNRVAINKALTVLSVNGPLVTVIQGSSPTGDGAVRCVYMTNGAALIGFTLTQGATRTDGDRNAERSAGGIWCESSDAIILNCVIAGNTADAQVGGVLNGTLFDCVVSNNIVPWGVRFFGYYQYEFLGYSGGAQGSGMNHCLVISNSAGLVGGGVNGGTLNDCVLTGNSSGDGGAAFGATLNNCVLTNNSASGGGGAEACTLDGCVLTGNGSYSGGGAYSSILTNCILTGNTAVGGGGAYNSTLVGCTLSGNSTYDTDEGAGTGGGANGCTLENCSLYGNSSSYGGGAEASALVNCTLIGNLATQDGGGACQGTLNNCILSTNSASGGGSGRGGGACSATLNNCTLTGNVADELGGGACYSTLSNCVLSGNSSYFVGGGTYDSTLNNCTLNGNLAYAGGGTGSSTLNNCALTGNSAWNGGGAYLSTLNNCTLTGNAAGNGGGAYVSTLNNCIVYFNTAPTDANCLISDLNYCCTTPLPDSGTGNITNEPQLADFAHISAGSPCRGAGSAAYVSGVDIDGEAWLNPPSMGCDEYYPGAITGALSVAIQADYPNVVTGFVVNFTVQISGHASLNTWDFGDGTVVSNQLYASHSWASPGDYPVVLTVYNDDNPGGVSVTVMVYVAEGTNYVSLDSTNPVPPYLSWDTAATNIQDAVDAAAVGATVLVSNGVYQAGGRVVYGSLTNRVVINKAVTVQSVNGPTVTVIQGYQDPNTVVGDDAVRCVYLTNNAALIGFTLTGGATRSDGDGMLEQSGGGAWCESNNAIITDCVLIANVANNNGGGAERGTLTDCTLTGNSVVNFWSAYGGGADSSILNNCELTGNCAGGFSVEVSIKESKPTGPTPMMLVFYYGGGAENSTLNNCTLIGNQSNGGGGGADSSTLNNCIVTDNSAGYGGGVENSTLNNCTLTGNSGSEGINIGGAEDSTLNNCIVYYNTNGGDYGNCTLNYCCTAQPPDNGIGNITNEPAFVDLAGGDFHLQPNSPCINAGNNSFVILTNDLDGNPRIRGGTVDIGAYEYQTPTSVISYAWLQQYGLTNDGSADFADTDGDGFNNWNEWRAGTIPTDPSSLLKMTAVTNDVSGITVIWQSVSGITYFLQRSTDLGAQPAFSTIQTGIAGQPDTTSYTDTDATSAGPYFYRVGVQ